MSISEKITGVNPQYIWVLLIIAFAIPILHPLGIPIPIEEGPRRVFDRIEQLKEGDIVLYEITGGLSVVAEAEPANTVIVKQLFDKGVKIIFYTLGVQGDPFYRVVIDNVDPERYNAEYGTDYVFLGYIAGGETAEVGMMQDIRNTAPYDYTGITINDLPLMKGISTVHDVDLLIAMYTGIVPSKIRSYSVTGGQSGERAWVAITTMANLPPVLPYIESNDVYGVIGGSVHAAEYEIISGFLGNGVKRTDIVSMSHLFQITLVIITNIAFFMSKLTGRAK